MQRKQLPSQKLLREWLIYDPLTGVFTWRKDPSRGVKRRGSVAGTRRKDGYIFIGLTGFGPIGAARLAWVYVHGSIPDGMEVDHKDVNPSNNALSNLRLATSSEQKMNKRVQSNNRSGLKGAYYHEAHAGKKWRSQIKTEDKRLVFLGYFHTAEEAHEAYGKACLVYHGEFSRAA